MIRFIDIRNQGTGERFAFWSTITDTFHDFEQNYAWSNWEEFLADAAPVCSKEKINRFKRLCPEWAFNKDEDNLEDFYREPDQARISTRTND